MCVGSEELRNFLWCRISLFLGSLPRNNVQVLITWGVYRSKIKFWSFLPTPHNLCSQSVTKCRWACNGLFLAVITLAQHSSIPCFPTHRVQHLPLRNGLFACVTQWPIHNTVPITLTMKTQTALCYYSQASPHISHPTCWPIYQPISISIPKIANSIFLTS